MKRSMLFVAVATVAILAYSTGDLLGGRGRGGGGGGRGGGGFSGGGGGGRVSGGGGASVGDRGGGLGAGGAGPGGGRVSGGPVGGAPGSGPGKSVGAGPKVGGGPSKGQLDSFLDLGGSKSGPGAGPGAGKGPGAVADFFEKGPGSGSGATGPGKGITKGNLPGAKLPGAKAGQLPASRPTRVENRQQLSQQRQGRRQEIQNEFRDNHPRWDFATDHPRWAAWRVNRPFRWATVAALTGWCSLGESTYYDYGENMYYEDGNVVADGKVVSTADEYAASAEQIVTGIPEAKDPEWMPLGVFAVTQDGKESGTTPTMFVQLAVSKQGIIAGALQNTGAGTTQPLEGMVNKETQRAAWVICGKSRPIMETGVFNLTKDTAPALLHFADGQTQQWLLVRMDEPKE